MKITQTTIDKLAWWIILLLLLVSIATFAKLSSDDSKKFKILSHNQNTLICVVKGFAEQPPPPDFIDNCVKANK